MASHSSILAWRMAINREARWATVHGVTKSQTRLSEQAQYHTLKLLRNHLDGEYIETSL